MKYVIIENRSSNTSDLPQGIIENCLADCWQELLACNRPNRFTLLTINKRPKVVPELLRMIEQRFGLHTTDDLTTTAPSIASLTKTLEISNNFKQKTLVTLRDDKQGPKIILVPGFGGNAWNYQEIANNFSSPCTLQAINIDTLCQFENTDLTQDILLDKVIEQLNITDDKRPLWIGGYSFGALIASNLVQKLTIRINGVLLMDPRPLNKLRWWSYNQKVLTYKMKNYFVSNNISSSPQSFETNMQYSRLLQRKMFCNFKVSLPKTPVKLLISKNINIQFPPSSYMNIDPLLCEITEIDVEHLDILRLPFVKKTAQWIEGAVGKA